MKSQQRTKNKEQRTGDRQAVAFTLIEVLVAVALLGMAMAMTFTTFYSVANA